MIMEKKIYFLLLFLVSTISICVGCREQASDISERITTQSNLLKLDIPSPNWTHAAKVGDELFVGVNGDKTNRASVNELISINVKTKEQRVLFRSKHLEAIVQWVQANKHWVVWEDSTSFGDSSVIWGMDRKTGETFQIAESSSSLPTVFDPILNGDNVAWTEKGSSFGEVKLYHLSTRQTETIGRIVSQGLYNEFVSLRDDKVVWTDSENGRGYYYIYDIPTATTNRYEAPAPFPAYAVYDNGLIYALHFRDLRYLDDQKFGYFDVKKKVFSVFPIKHGIIRYFDAAKGKVAFLDEKGQVSIYERHDGKWKTLKERIDPRPLFLSFDQQGHLILKYEDTEHDRRWLNIIEW